MGLSKTIRGSLSAIGLGGTKEPGGKQEGVSLQHAWGDEPPEFSIHQPRYTPRQSDVALCERVINAYHAARAAEGCLRSDELPADDAWQEIGDKHHAEFQKLLTKRDVRGVATVLANALQNPVTFGLNWDESNRQAFEIAAQESDSSGFGLTLADRLISLGEAVGALGAEYGDHSVCANLSNAGLTQIYQDIESAVDFRLGVPECFGLFGIRAGRHMVHPMLASHAYAAWRIRQVLDGLPKARVCEIGGGYGGLAYYVAQSSPKSYTILDLPIVNALQGYFLGRTIGPEAVRLFGEPAGQGALQILPYWEIANIPDDSVDLVVSQESLPEIDRKIAASMLAEAHRITQGLFLSINHESAARIHQGGFKHNVVAELAAEQRGFHRAYRFPTWLQRGLVEELFELPHVRDQRIHARKSTAAGWA